MKRIISILLSAVLCLPMVAEEQPITFNDLPAPAKMFIQTYFKDLNIQKVYIERRASLTQYEVDLDGGVDLQFDRTGACTEVNCKRSAVPDNVVPKKLLATIKEHFAKNYIQKYEHNGRMYEITLDNGTVLTFSNTGRLIDIDK